MGQYSKAFYASAGDMSTTGYYAVAKWAATTAYTVGMLVRQTAPAVGQERVFVCTIAGTSAATEPSWVTSAMGAVVTESSGVKWQECTGQAPPNGDLANTPTWAFIRSLAATVNAGAGAIIIDTAGTHYFIADTAGNIGASEPSWNTAAGGTTTDGAATWRCLGAVGTVFTVPWGAPIPWMNEALSTNWYLFAASVSGIVPSILYVADNSVENYSGTYSITHSWSVGNPIYVISADHTAALPPPAKPGATIGGAATTALSWGNSLGGATASHVNGVTFSCSGTGANCLQFYNTGFGQACRQENCTWVLSATTGVGSIYMGLAGAGNAGTQIETVNHKVNFNAVGQSLTIGQTRWLWRGGQVGGTAAPSILMCPYSGGVDVLIEAVDLSALGSGKKLYSHIAGAGFNTAIDAAVVFKDCKLGAGVTICDSFANNAGFNSRVEASRCDQAGVFINARFGYGASETTTTAVVRSGGANDNGTPIAHQVTTTTGYVSWGALPYKAMPWCTWNAVTGTNRNVTSYGIVNDYRIPNNDEVWTEIEYLGSSGSPLGSLARATKSSILAGAAALTADAASAWDGAAPNRSNSFSYALNNPINSGAGNGRVFFCINPGTSASATPSSTTATWNPSDNSTSLSNGNLTAHFSSVVSPALARGFVPRAAKFYFEVTVTTPGAAANVGICLASATASSWGNSNAGFGAYVVSGAVINNGSTAFSVGAVANNDVLCFAIDMVNLKGWVRRNGGPWNGVTAADPVANIFGVDLSGMFTPTAPPYPSVGIGTGTNSTNFTANFGATAFAQTKPAGYGDATLQTYASAVDGETVHDGSAVFRAGCRFSQNVVLSTPQPQQPGYLYVYPHVAGRSDNKGSAVQTASIGYVLDPKINLT